MNWGNAVYRLSFGSVLFISICMILCCCSFNYLSQRAAVKRGINALGCIVSIVGVLAFTLLSRTGGQGVFLTPFRFLELAKNKPELYRSFYMNVFLFVPLGVFMPYAISSKPRLRNVFITVGIGFLLSVGVECLQYWLSRGLSETDDVIANTLGAVIGTMSYCLYLYITKNGEVSPIRHKLNSEQALLLDCVADAYFDKTAALPQELDVEALISHARKQTVFPAVYLTLKKNSLTDPVINKAFERQIAKNAIVEGAHVELCDSLHKNGIAYVVIKGVASAAYYKDPVIRTMGDVDILVAEQDVARADELLRSIGYMTEDDITLPKRHFAYTRGTGKRGPICELHRKVTGIPSNERGTVAERYLVNILTDAQTVKTECGECLVPSDFHHGLILLLHTAQHLTNEGVGLRHLCDWAVFAERFSNEAFLEMFETPLKEIGIWRFAQLLTLCCVKYLGCTPKAWAGTAPDALLEDIVCDIMTGGNFGYSDKDRYRQIKYISDREKSAVSGRNPLWQAFRSIHAKTKQELKFFREHPVFLPVGWLVTVCRYLWLVVTGKRKTDSLKTIKAAQERKNIYDEFALFQNGEND